MFCRCYCCKVHFSSDTSVRTACPDTIREIVSPATGLAVVTLVTDGRTHRIKLPVGSYQYEVYGDDKPCQIAIEVKGMYNLFRVSVDRKSTRLNSSHLVISYAVFCLKKKKLDMSLVLYILTLKYLRQ